MTEPTAASTGGYRLPVFPYRRPAELAGAVLRHRVAVAGGGLTGLALACDLASRGVPVVLLDEDDTVGVRGASSRGICYAQKTLECFERLGLYERVRAKGVTWSVGRVLVDDEVVYSFDLAAESLSRQPPFINLQQFYTEWFLVERIMELPAAEIRWRNRIVTVEAGEEGVRLGVETPDGGYELEADWLVDATGHASPIRAALGLGMSGEEGWDRWCITDVRFEKELPAERWTWIEAGFNQGRAVWQHPMADGVWRIDYQMAPDADPALIARPEVVAERLRVHLGPEIGVEPVWIGPYGYRTRLMDRFRHGRVLFAGDAAHVMSPFGARGGNSGVQDAENLAWKLAAVLMGQAPEALLDSYDTERRAAARHNLAVTARTTRFLAPRSPFEHALRDAALSLARRHRFAQALVNAGRMSQPFDYAPSPLTGEGGGAAVPNMAIRHEEGGEGGLHDLLRGEGAPFLALCYPPAGMPGLPPGLAVAYACNGAVPGLPRIDGEGLARLALPGEALVIRPDGHLAARLRQPGPGAVHAAIDRALMRTCR